MGVQSICGEHKLLLHKDIQVGVQWTSKISLPKTNNVFSTDGLNTKLLLFVLHNIQNIYTFDGFCRFKLETIFYRKEVPAM